ncbi:collagen alpha-2(V) chain-like [Gigantopelta aegis]|uniref:collagen alpha-2(V) chain-like n=1 Tax=Gigantopelta aegis TaxID=1735272 RepID=UPI001B88B062|nr:collagen alpha-2(V) chain-like [Gigantopelta aegis]
MFSCNTCILAVTVWIVAYSGTRVTAWHSFSNSRRMSSFRRGPPPTDRIQNSPPINNVIEKGPPVPLIKIPRPSPMTVAAVVVKPRTACAIQDLMSCWFTCYKLRCPSYPQARCTGMRSGCTCRPAWVWGGREVDCSIPPPIVDLRGSQDLVIPIPSNRRRKFFGRRRFGDSGEDGFRRRRIFRNRPVKPVPSRNIGTGPIITDVPATIIGGPGPNPLPPVGGGPMGPPDITGPVPEPQPIVPVGGGPMVKPDITGPVPEPQPIVPVGGGPMVKPDITGPVPEPKPIVPIGGGQMVKPDITGPVPEPQPIVPVGGGPMVKPDITGPVPEPQPIVPVGGGPMVKPDITGPVPEPKPIVPVGGGPMVKPVPETQPIRGGPAPEPQPTGPIGVIGEPSGIIGSPIGPQQPTGPIDIIASPMVSQQLSGSINVIGSPVGPQQPSGPIDTTGSPIGPQQPTGPIDTIGSPTGPQQPTGPITGGPIGGQLPGGPVDVTGGQGGPIGSPVSPVGAGSRMIDQQALAILQNEVCDPKYDVADCAENPCFNQTCGIPGSVCRQSRCGACHAKWFVGNEEVDCSPECVPGVRKVRCLFDPCSRFTCPAFPNAVCRVNRCRSCRAVWSVAGVPVNCDIEKQDCPPDQVRTCPRCWVQKCPSDVSARCRVTGCTDHCGMEFYKVSHGVVEVINCTIAGMFPSRRG